MIFSLLNKGAVLPFHHQGILANFINQFLPQSEGNIPLHDWGLNFSGLKGQTLVTREGLAYTSSKVTVVISSHSQALIDHLVKNIFSQRKELIVGGLKLVPHQVLIEEPPAFDRITKYVMISPVILVTEAGDAIELKKFIHPERRSFYQLLKAGTYRRMLQAGVLEGKGENDFLFNFKPDLDYLNKVKRSEKKFSRIYQALVNNSLMEIRGYTFPFALEADEITHRFIFERGLGELTHLGYGMTDTVSNMFAARVRPYAWPGSEQMNTLLTA